MDKPKKLILDYSKLDSTNEQYGVPINPPIKESGTKYFLDVTENALYRQEGIELEVINKP